MPWLGITHLQRSLQRETANIAAMYNIAIMYGQLGKHDLQFLVLQYAMKVCLYCVLFQMLLFLLFLFY